MWNKHMHDYDDEDFNPLKLVVTVIVIIAIIGLNSEKSVFVPFYLNKKVDFFRKIEHNYIITEVMIKNGNSGNISNKYITT